MVLLEGIWKASHLNLFKFIILKCFYRHSFIAKLPMDETPSRKPIFATTSMVFFWLWLCLWFKVSSFAFSSDLGMVHQPWPPHGPHEGDAGKAFFCSFVQDFVWTRPMACLDREMGWTSGVSEEFFPGGKKGASIQPSIWLLPKVNGDFLASKSMKPQIFSTLDFSPFYLVAGGQPCMFMISSAPKQNCSFVTTKILKLSRFLNFNAIPWDWISTSDHMFRLETLMECVDDDSYLSHKLHLQRKQGQIFCLYHDNFLELLADFFFVFGIWIFSKVPKSDAWKKHSKIHALFWRRGNMHHAASEVCLRFFPGVFKKWKKMKK